MSNAKIAGTDVQRTQGPELRLFKCKRFKDVHDGIMPVKIGRTQAV